MCPRCRREVPKGLSDTVPPIQCLKCFFGIRGDREGVVDVDVDTCGWRWMVLPGGFKYFLFLEISNPPCFFFRVSWSTHLRSIFFFKMAWVVGFKLPTRCGSFCQIFDRRQFCWFERDLFWGSSWISDLSTDREFESPGRCIIGWTMDETYVSLCESWILTSKFCGLS